MRCGLFVETTQTCTHCARRAAAANATAAAPRAQSHSPMCTEAGRDNGKAECIRCAGDTRWVERTRWRKCRQRRPCRRQRRLYTRRRRHRRLKLFTFVSSVQAVTAPAMPSGTQKLARDGHTVVSQFCKFLFTRRPRRREPQRQCVQLAVHATAIPAPAQLSQAYY